MTIKRRNLSIWIWYNERMRMVIEMIQKFTISWFQREAGLFFFTMAMISILVLTGGGFFGKGVLIVQAGEQTAALETGESKGTADGEADTADATETEAADTVSRDENIDRKSVV